MANSLKIFSGTASRDLAEKIVSFLDMSLGDSSINRFSDGVLPGGHQQGGLQQLFLISDMLGRIERINQE